MMREQDGGCENVTSRNGKTHPYHPSSLHRKNLSNVCSWTEANMRQNITAPPLEWTVDA
jgi:hypothetical protein